MKSAFKSGVRGGLGRGKGWNETGPCADCWSWVMGMWTSVTLYFCTCLKTSVTKRGGKHNNSFPAYLITEETSAVTVHIYSKSCRSELEDWKGAGPVTLNVTVISVKTENHRSVKTSPSLSLTFTAATAPGASTATWDLLQDTCILTQDRCTDPTGLVTLIARTPDTVWVPFHVRKVPHLRAWTGPR